MPNIVGYAATSAKAPLSPFTFTRREPGPKDVQIEILYCGVCHSDIHKVRSEWGPTIYPCVPGHEIVGRVIKAGAKVRHFKIGDLAGVGCMVDSCRECPSCQKGEEQFCEKDPVWTYDSPDKISCGVTYGGYSTQIVVSEDFVLKVPANLNLSAVAPLLCAGITTYSPLRFWKAGKGKKVGIVGLGGLGHMGIKLAHAMGAHTVLFTTSAHKADDAKRLGADEVVLSNNPGAVHQHLGSFDFILDTVSAPHDLNAYLGLLKTEATLCLVGLPSTPHLPFNVFNLVPHRSLAGSLIGGIRETQEMLDFCAEHNIVSDVEIIPMKDIDKAYERMLKSDVKYRFVIDMASLKASE